MLYLAFQFLRFADIVMNLTLYDRIVKIPRRVVNDHFRCIVSNDLFLVDKPPEETKENKEWAITISIFVFYFLFFLFF